MTGRYRDEPPDEPIIGGTHFTTTAYRDLDDEPVIGAPYPAVPAVEPYQDEWSPDEVEEGYEEEYYDDEYDSGDYGRAVHPRSLSYLVIGVGVLVVLGLGALAFALFQDGNGEEEGPALEVRIDAPQANQRVEVGKALDVVAQASSNEGVTSFELFADDVRADQFTVANPNPGALERATLQHIFTTRGDHQLFVRVISKSGAIKDSDRITVVATEQIGDLPSSIKGRLVAAANARTGPGENFPGVGPLASGEDVTIKGKTRNGEWLLVDSSAGQDVWVRRTAVDFPDSLALVPVKEPTVTPRPAATSTPTPQASTTPTPDKSLPDYLPAGAALIEGGAKLRVTVQNTGGGDYSGALVVSVSGVGPGTETQAFNVTLTGKGGTASVDFAINPAATSQKVAKVTVDVGDAVKEAAEDNNIANFTVSPPVEQPNIVITSAVVQGNNVQVTIRNNGGPLASSEVTVRVSVGSNANSQTQMLALANGQTAPPFTVAKPGSGQGTVQVLVGTQVVASQPITIP